MKMNIKNIENGSDKETNKKYMNSRQNFNRYTFFIRILFITNFGDISIDYFVLLLI